MHNTNFMIKYSKSPYARIDVFYNCTKIMKIQLTTWYNFLKCKACHTNNPNYIAKQAPSSTAVVENSDTAELCCQRMLINSPVNSKTQAFSSNAPTLNDHWNCFVLLLLCCDNLVIM